MSAFKAIAQRIVNAENGMIEAIAQAGGLDAAQARAAFDTLRKVKALKLDAVGGVYNVKHGRFLDRDVLRRAAGLE